MHEISEKAQEMTNSELHTSHLEEILSSILEKVPAIDEPQTPIPPTLKPTGQSIYVHVIIGHLL